MVLSLYTLKPFGFERVAKGRLQAALEYLAQSERPLKTAVMTKQGKQ